MKKKVMNSRLLRIFSIGLIMCMAFGVMQIPAMAYTGSAASGIGNNIEFFNNGSVTVTNYPLAVVGQYYDFTPTILTNHNPGYESLTYHIRPEAVNGEIPSYFGLSCDTSTGRVYGTPTRDGRLFVYLSYDGVNNFNALIVTIKKAVTSPTVSDLHDGVVGEDYVVSSFSMNDSVSGTGYFTCDEDTLPPGLFYNPSGHTTVLSGVPTQAGTYNVKFTAVNGPSSVDVYKQIIIQESTSSQTGVPVSNSTLTLNPSAKTLYSGQIGGNAAEWEFTSTAYPSPTWTVDESTLPANTVFSNIKYSDGKTLIRVIHKNSTFGTDEITPGGNYTVRVTASNIVNGQTYTKSYELPLTVCLPAGYAGLNLRTNHDTATVGEYKSIALDPTFTVAAYPAPTYSVSTGFNVVPSLVTSGLPDGMTLDPATATISGTPTQAGRYIILVHAKNPYVLANGNDAQGTTADWDTFSLDISEGGTTPPTPTEIKLVDSAENDLEGSAIKVITGEKTITIKDSSDAVVTGATVAYKKFNKTSGEFDTTVTPTGVSFNAVTGVITFGSTKSQLVKATVSVGGSEVGSIIYIVPGDANFSGSVNDYDWQAIISRLHGSNQSADIMYGSLNLSKLMADVNSVKIENPGVNDYDWQQLISSMH